MLSIRQPKLLSFPQFQIIFIYWNNIISFLQKERYKDMEIHSQPLTDQNREYAK